MIKRTLLAAGVVLGLLGIVPPSASAAITCPYVVTHDTTLTADLDCTSYTSGDAVTFAGPGLTLDLNGHAIEGPVGSDTTDGVAIYYNNDTVKSGTIENFETQVYADAASETRLTNLKLNGDPADTYGEGIYIEYGAGNLIRNVVATGEYYAFDLEYAADNRVVHNISNQSTGYSFYTYEETKDLFKGNKSHGISGTTYGFYDDDYSDLMSYVGNSANNGYDGFYLDCDGYGVPTRISGNTANGNSSYGFYIYDCYNLEDYHQGGALIQNNTANNNGYDGFYDYYTINSTWSGNTAINNGEYGFNLDYPANDVILNNVSNLNQNDTGFYLEDNYSEYSPQTFSFNVANNNAAYGFYADYATPGKANRAHGNPVSNCDGVRCS
jgi:parallel beta-helix repeat protein